MTSTFTPNYNIEQPANNDYIDTWDVPVNADWAIIDKALGASVQISLTNVDVNLTTSQAQNKRLYLTGTLTGNVNLLLPLAAGSLTVAVGGTWVVDNATTGAFSVTIKTVATGSTGVACPQGYTSSIVSDGTNVKFADSRVLAITGPTGPAGAAGATGPTGAAGPTGPAGGGGGGDVASVTVSGGSTGLTASGPTTGVVVQTLAGTLNVTNGGTGAISATAARTNLGAAALGANTFTGTQNLNGQILQNPLTQTYSLVTNARGSVSGTIQIDLNLGNNVTATITGNCNFQFFNAAASPNACGFILQITNGGAYTVSWPASAKWPGGTPPSLTASGTDVLVFYTTNGGTTWRGAVSMLDSK